jgi:hypothetical protein
MSGWSACSAPLPGFDSFFQDCEVEGISGLEAFSERYPLFWSVFGPDAPFPGIAPNPGPQEPDPVPSLDIDWFPPAPDSVDWSHFLDGLD